jgi:hypothetical protein
MKAMLFSSLMVVFVSDFIPYALAKVDCHIQKLKWCIA